MYKVQQVLKLLEQMWDLFINRKNGVIPQGSQTRCVENRLPRKSPLNNKMRANYVRSGLKQLPGSGGTFCTHPFPICRDIPHNEGNLYPFENQRY